MAITPITSTENTKSHIPYIEAQGTVHTENNIKPLPPQGHLVHDTILNVPKYFLKDIAYDKNYGISWTGSFPKFYVIIP